jgi:hypothetical protein
MKNLNPIRNVMAVLLIGAMLVTGLVFHKEVKR